MTLQERIDAVKKEFEEGTKKLEQVNQMKVAVETRLYELRGQHQALEQIMKEMSEPKKEEPSNV